MTVPTIQAPRFNIDFDWDNFNPVAYVSRNYSPPHLVDLDILAKMRNFFADVGAIHRTPWTAKGIDVGSGPNLYPALAMLPYCEEITLSDLARSNVDWLEKEVRSYSETWDPFWDELAKIAPYGDIKHPRWQLDSKVELKQGNLFDLPRARWDIGTMFFVAESISKEAYEFIRATYRFVRALKPNAPFAAAFMENSEGYGVGGRPFPAVKVNRRKVRDCLADVAHDVRIHRWGVDPKARLRVGYTGMILALGRAGRG